MYRPDLTNIDPEIAKYIEYLEAKVRIFGKSEQDTPSERTPETFPPEPETTFCLVTISAKSNAKRTYRHLYTRQHRGGIGVYDLEISQPDYLRVVGIADENQTILVLTDRARAFRFSVQQLMSTGIRDRGYPAFERLGFEPAETVSAIIPVQARGYLAILGTSGKVRLLRHHLFGEHMKPGTVLFNTAEFGQLISACWTPGDAEIFIVTSAGMGIRFLEKVISPQGDLGIRLGGDDTAVGITSLTDESNIFMIGADGRGTVRQMNGFAANKSSGGSGKIAFKNNKVVGCVAVNPTDEIFVATRYGKSIRFQADEIPVTEGPVQGVNCISLRADEVTAIARNIRE
jgi:DNA gyrase subunit A